MPKIIRNSLILLLCLTLSGQAAAKVVITEALTLSGKPNYAEGFSFYIEGGIMYFKKYNMQIKGQKMYIVNINRFNVLLLSRKTGYFKNIDRWYD